MLALIPTLVRGGWHALITASILDGEEGKGGGALTNSAQFIFLHVYLKNSTPIEYFTYCWIDADDYQF